MPTLSDRSFRVAITGRVPDDDPHIIADMQMEIERLTDENAALRHDLEKALANHAADLTNEQQEPPKHPDDCKCPNCWDF